MHFLIIHYLSSTNKLTELLSITACSIAVAAASIAAGNVTDNTQSAEVMTSLLLQTDRMTDRMSDECIISSIHYIHLADKINHNCLRSKPTSKLNYLAV